MSLKSLQITNFRNLKHVELELHPRCNLFYGPNGSGKTSVLEAIHYLGLGRSFRSHILKRLINYDTSKFSIFGKIISNESSTLIPAGIERSTLDKESQIKINSEAVRSTAELAKLLPLQLLNQNVYYFFEHGPKYRRQFIDWGVFHVEPTFLSLWKKADQIIAQRNVLLKSRASGDQIKCWDTELATIGEEIHIQREKYLTHLFSTLKTFFLQTLPDIDVSIEYFRGWSVSDDLHSSLVKSFARDLQFGYTTVGPHRADIIIQVDHVPAHDALSRGQLKMLLYALKLAQGNFLKISANKPCIYLLDDITAELDEAYQQKIVCALDQLNSQLFVTGLDQNKLKLLFPNDSTLFHVEQIIKIRES